ncbi:MAG: DUF1799 domain-containing protein [Gammaproteobacteria bacterium]|nr:DUF1799 domain-containing protein [Gammaproteobacteria bacterium]
MEALRAVGETPAQEDLPPPLQWEAPIWRLYCQLGTQWRIGPQGALLGLDLNAFWPAITRAGWDTNITLDLLAVIEAGFMGNNTATNTDADDE